jgi:hypothetical protein
MTPFQSSFELEKALEAHEHALKARKAHHEVNAISVLLCDGEDV